MLESCESLVPTVVPTAENMGTSKEQATQGSFTHFKKHSP